ncbi:MAG TPA: patatin-like phospholipase family protein [Propionibacteriaceae bacterium]
MVGKRVALVLGSGGARGYAHIGAIDVLTERGYEIVAVSGSSMGALVGGLHAAGKLDDYTEWVTSLNQRDVLRLLDVSLNGPGVLRLERVLARMTEYLDGVLIEDLPIPYTAVASDLGARREVWFTSGPLETAIRASIAIPAMITPIMVNGRLLVDGGVLNPVPMEPVMGVDADFTLAINLSGEKAHHFGSSPTRETAAQRPPNEWLDRFRRTAAGVWENDFIASILARFSRPDDADHPAYDPPPPGLGITDVTWMSLDAMGSLITRYRLAALPPDILVTVATDSAKAMDFHRAAELIALGRTLTEAALDEAFGDDAPEEPQAEGRQPEIEAPTR